MSEDDVGHKEKLENIIQSNHYIRQRVQESVNEFLCLRQTLLDKLKTKELNNISNDCVPLIDAMRIETLNKQVTSDKVQLALCGENSSGKTSFIHLLLEIGSILPADIGPITARIVRMTYAKPEEACAIIYPTLEESFKKNIIGTRIDLAKFFIVNDEDDEPNWKGISKELDEHVRRPKGMDIQSDEFAVWAKHFIEIRLPSPTLKLGIDVYDTAGFRRRDAKILKDCLYDLVRVIHPTIVFLYDNPSSTNETNECFNELKNTLKHLDSSNIFFLNTKADIDKMPDFDEVETKEQFIEFTNNERIKRYGLLLKTPGMVNGMIGGLPKTFDQCHCFDICSVMSENIEFGSIMNKNAVQRLIQFVANSDLIMAQRVSNLVLPAIEAFFDLNLITSHRTDDQIKQLRKDALEWIENYFEKHDIAFDKFLRDTFENVKNKLLINEKQIINRAAQQIELSNIQIFIEVCIQQEIMKGVVYDAIGLLPTIVSDLIRSNQNLTINVTSNEILISALRKGVDDRPDIIDEEPKNANILKSFMKDTFTTPILIITNFLFNEENNQTRNNLLSSTKSSFELNSSSSNSIQDAQQYLKEIHQRIKNAEKTINNTISAWCLRLKDKLKEQINEQYNAAITVLPNRHRVHDILQQYIHQFVGIECQLQAAQDLAKFNGEKPIIRSFNNVNSDSMTTVYTLDEIEWGTINKNLFVKRLTQPIPNRPYTSYLEAHYHRKITNLNIPNILKLTYLYENPLSNSLYEFWMIFETRTIDIKRNLKNFIHEHQQQNKTISLRKNFEIILSIIDALTGLHENELVHRNIKLSNILLDENDKSCLADLGNWCLLNTDQSNHVEWRHYLSKSSDGILKDIQDFGQLSFTLCSIIDSDDLESSTCREYKQIMSTCMSIAPPKAAAIRQDLKYLYDNLK